MVKEIKNSINKHKKLVIIVGLIAFICLGFYIHKVSDPVYRLFRPVISSVDQSMFDYRCYHDMYGAYRCSFHIISDNAEGLGDELKLIYEKSNQILKSAKKGIHIEIIISVPRFEYGSYNTVAVFKNFENSKVYDHICYVRGDGIDSEAKMYNSNYDYEINHREYWEYFSDVEQLLFPQNQCN